MTFTGEAHLELSFIFGSTGRGDEVLQEVAVDNFAKSKVFTTPMGTSLTKQERDAIWCALPEWLQEKLVAQANEDAEPDEDTDDAACDEERVTRRAG